MNATAHGIRRFVNRIAIGVLALLLAGCVTQQQVKQIVADSNARIISSQLPDPQLSSKPGEHPEEKDPAARIEDFIAEHPDQKALNGSLRVRQAIIFLSRKEYNRADAAFKAARDLSPPTARDQALVAVHESLIWWYENSELSKVDATRAASARKALADEARKRATSPDIRDFLAEASGWVGLMQVGSMRTTLAEQKQAMEQTMDDYAFILDAEDLAWLCTPPLTDKTDKAVARRKIRALELLTDAAQYAEQMDDKPRFEKSQLQELIAPMPSSPRKCTRTLPRK